MDVVIGTAGWSISRADASAFPATGTALARYSRIFDGVEVNSSFHRPHRRSTWAKWAASVPDKFRFSVKIPKAITHQAKLQDVGELIEEFALEVGGLGEKLGILLVQLPPALRFDALVAERFFETLRRSISAEIVCEPRNPTWFEDEAEEMLRELRIARVAADPALSTAASLPGGWRGVAYRRLHGSPRIYRSAYMPDAIAAYAQQIRAELSQGRDTWCVFDNTAGSAATSNALSLISKI